MDTENADMLRLALLSGSVPDGPDLPKNGRRARPLSQSFHGSMPLQAMAVGRPSSSEHVVCMLPVVCELVFDRHV
jgi:hypothetical protein